MSLALFLDLVLLVVAIGCSFAALIWVHAAGRLWQLHAMTVDSEEGKARLKRDADWRAWAGTFCLMLALVSTAGLVAS